MLRTPSDASLLRFLLLRLLGTTCNRVAQRSRLPWASLIPTQADAYRLTRLGNNDWGLDTAAGEAVVAVCGIDLEIN